MLKFDIHVPTSKDNEPINEVAKVHYKQVCIHIVPKPVLELNSPVS